MLIEMAYRAAAEGGLHEISPKKAGDAHKGFVAHPLRQATSLGTELYHLEFYLEGNDQPECRAILGTFMHPAAVGSVGDKLLVHPLSRLLFDLFNRHVPVSHPTLRVTLPAGSSGSPNTYGDALRAFVGEDGDMPGYGSAGDIHYFGADIKRTAQTDRSKMQYPKLCTICGYTWPAGTLSNGAFASQKYFCNKKTAGINQSNGERPRYYYTCHEVSARM